MQVQPNNSFKPTPLHGHNLSRYVACSIVAVQRRGLTQVLGTMTKFLAIGATLISLMAFDVNAASPCFSPPLRDALARSSSVVAATPITISIKKFGPDQTQTVLWTVNESWKGPHYKRSTFTTRNTWVAPVNKGQPWLLYLSGREPYQIQPTPCARSQPLQEALPDVWNLYKAIEATRNGP